MIISRIVKIFVSGFNLNAPKKVTEMPGVRVKLEVHVHVFEALVTRTVHGCAI